MFVIDLFKFYLYGFMLEVVFCECYKNLVLNNWWVIEKLFFLEILLEKGVEIKRYF